MDISLLCIKAPRFSILGHARTLSYMSLFSLSVFIGYLHVYLSSAAAYGRVTLLRSRTRRCCSLLSFTLSRTRRSAPHRLLLFFFTLHCLARLSLSPLGDLSIDSRVLSLSHGRTHARFRHHAWCGFLRLVRSYVFIGGTAFNHRTTPHFHLVSSHSALPLAELSRGFRSVARTCARHLALSLSLSLLRLCSTAHCDISLARRALSVSGRALFYFAPACTVHSLSLSRFTPLSDKVALFLHTPLELLASYSLVCLSLLWVVAFLPPSLTVALVLLSIGSGFLWISVPLFSFASSLSLHLSPLSLTLRFCTLLPFSHLSSLSLSLAVGLRAALPFSALLLSLSLAQLCLSSLSLSPPHTPFLSILLHLVATASGILSPHTLSSITR